MKLIALSNHTTGELSEGAVCMREDATNGGIRFDLGDCNRCSGQFNLSLAHLIHDLCGAAENGCNLGRFERSLRELWSAGL